MENEELAALRATLLAAQRQPLAVKVRQARLSALLADGDELLPYVLSRSCSDPRDRTLEREELVQLRVLEGADKPRVASHRTPRAQARADSVTAQSAGRVSCSADRAVPDQPDPGDGARPPALGTSHRARDEDRYGTGSSPCRTG